MTVRARGRRLLLVALLALAAIYVVWLGVNVVRFRPPGSTAQTSGRAVGPPYEVTGIYHVHTRFSDGRATPDEVAAVAARRSLDFVILTDHGSPNLKSLESQGRKGGVLVFAGSELSVSRGHLVGLDFAPPARPFSQNADLAIREIAADGGFSIIAHPYSKTPWTWGGEAASSGIEIINCDAEAHLNYLRFFPYLPAFLVKPELVLLKSLSRPVETLRKWDSLAARRAVTGYFGADAHMFYDAVFGCLRLHVLLPEPLAPGFERARAQVFGALRRGEFYNAVDGAAAAGGFRYWAEAGGTARPMGSTIMWDGASPVKLTVRASFPFAIETRLIRDGEVIERATGAGGGPELSYAARRPGVYRVEVYLRAWSPLAADCPWIVSNPIFIRRS
jgi:hypothetical protein